MCSRIGTSRHADIGAMWESRPAVALPSRKPTSSQQYGIRGRLGVHHGVGVRSPSWACPGWSVDVPVLDHSTRILNAWAMVLYACVRPRVVRLWWRRDSWRRGGLLTGQFLVCSGMASYPSSSRALSVAWTGAL